MGIVDEDVVRVRETTDLVAVVTQHTQLRKVGIYQVPFSVQNQGGAGSAKAIF